jgi:hypothetical protein
MAYFFMAAIVAPLVGAMVRRRGAAAAAAAVSAAAVFALGWIVHRSDNVIPPLFEPDRILQGVQFVMQPRATVAAIANSTRDALSGDRLSPATRARIGTNTADVLPVETAIVQANDMRWTPLPVFQAYVAYTAMLDGLNRDALVRRGARFVLYRNEPIDRRLPFGDMPATTAELLCRYRLAAARVFTAGSGDFMLLERAPGTGCTAVPAGAVEQPAMGRPIAVPRAARGTLITAAFALHPTLLTRATALLWRAPVVYFDIVYDDGSVDRRRAVTGTLGDGIVISVAPRDQAEAQKVFAGAGVPGVRSVTLFARPGTYVLDGVTFVRLRRTLTAARTR